MKKIMNENRANYKLQLNEILCLPRSKDLSSASKQHTDKLKSNSYALNYGN